MLTIKHRYTGTVLYEYPDGMAIRHALEKATTEKANLSGANLSGANLSGAYLSGAYLSGAYLSGAYLSGADLSRAHLRDANLSGAYLSGAYLSGAYLSGADLSGADLSRAHLRGADLSDANLSGADLSDANLSGALVEYGGLIGDRPIFQCGPIGSRSDYLLAFTTDKGIVVRAGCFIGTLDEFIAAVQKTHEDSDHGREYTAAIDMIRAHAAIWAPSK